MTAHPHALRDRVIRLHGQGWPTARIAAHVGLPSPQAVSHVLSRARRAGVVIPDGRVKRGLGASRHRFTLPPDAVAALKPAAAERGVTVHQLCRELIETIAADDLVAAVLDG